MSWCWGGDLQGEESCCLPPIPRDAFPPRVCNGSSNQIRCRGDRKNRRQAIQKAGRWVAMAPISFLSRVNGHNLPEPLL